MNEKTVIKNEKIVFIDISNYFDLLLDIFYPTQKDKQKSYENSLKSALFDTIGFVAEKHPELLKECIKFLFNYANSLVNKANLSKTEIDTNNINLFQSILNDSIYAYKVRIIIIQINSILELFDRKNNPLINLIFKKEDKNKFLEFCNNLKTCLVDIYFRLEHKDSEIKLWWDYIKNISIKLLKISRTLQRISSKISI